MGPPRPKRRSKSPEAVPPGRPAPSGAPTPGKIYSNTTTEIFGKKKQMSQLAAPMMSWVGCFLTD